MNLIHWLIVISLLLCRMTRCLIFNIHYAIYYLVMDIYEFLRFKKWQDFNYYGIDMFIGMFGHGKTLSMTHKARLLYKKYGDSIRFVSNYKLNDIPYVPLENFNQIVKLGQDALAEKPKYLEEGENPPPYYYDEKGNIKKEYRRKVKVGTDEYGAPILERRILRPVYKGTVVLIDEIEDLLSHRNYASFPLQMLNVLTQQRKAKIYIMCSAQRFFMVDKLFRSITTHVIDCSKYWRLQHMTYYDAWDYENAMNVQLIKRLTHKWWFVKNADFDCYDTTQMISEDMSEKFISNEESLLRKGLDASVNADAVSQPSRKLKKARKKK